MKTLLLLRHAKSSWKNEQLADHDRPLNQRGKHDAPRVGELLKEMALAPDLIISSTAKRARNTALKVAEQCDYQGSIELEGDLYLAQPARYITALRAVSDQCDRVMTVGHNPGVEQLLQRLTGHEMHLPTASLARIDLPIAHWHELSLETPGTLVDIWLPRERD